MPATVQSIVDATITELSQVPGSSTQIYAAPRILQYVEDTFDLCFQQNWWDAYISYWTGTLDGTTGRLTADIVPLSPNSNGLVPISLYTNIRNCYADGSNKTIRALPRGNPFLFINSSGATPLYRAADYKVVNRPIIFYPPSASGNVIMEVRQEPLHPFALTDLVYLDAKMLVFGAAYLYASDDGTNPGQINKFQSLFTKRMSDMVAAEGDTSPLQLDPRMAEFELQPDDDVLSGSFIIGTGTLVA